MPKVKSKSASKGDSAKSAKPDTKALSAVKEGRVTKAAQTPKAKSKKIAKAAAAKHGTEKKLSKKAKKEPTPEPESESDSSTASDNEDDLTSSSSASSDDESEVEKPTKINGAAKVQKKDASSAESSDASDSHSSSSDGSEDGSDAEPAKPAAKAQPAKVNGVNGINRAKKPAADDDSSSESEESDDEAPAVKASSAAAKDDDSDDTSEESGSSEAESDDEDKPAPKQKGAVDSGKLNGASENVKDAASSNEDSDASSGSDDSDADSDASEEDEEEVEEGPSKKRKADTAATPNTKKSKIESGAAGNEGVRNLFVGNLSWNIDEEWLHREFSEFGEISGCRVITDRETGRKKGFGYVEFASADSAKQALEAMSGKELDGRQMNVDYSTPRQNDNGGFKDRAQTRAKDFGDQKSQPSDTLFVGNISFDADEETIRQTFEEYGTLTRVSLPTDINTGAPKGFGYVGFSNVGEAKAAMEALNGVQVAGRAVRLDFATPRSNDGGSPRGGRGGGFGGRGGGRGDRSGRGGFGGRGGRGRGAPRGGGSYNRGGFGDFKGSKVTF